MSDNTSSNDSTDSKLAVRVAALGKVANEDYADAEGVADRVEEELNKLARMDSTKVGSIVLRSNYELFNVLSERFSGDDDPDVMYNGLDWRRLLDDEANTHDGNETAAVMQEDDLPVGEVMAEADDSFQAEHFDINNREHRGMVNYNEIDQSRINRAKAKAKAKADERCYNDWEEYDEPTVDHAIFLHDGTDTGMEAFKNARGQNDWVLYPNAVAGEAKDVNCNREQDDLINWSLFFAHTDPENLSDSQIEDLRETLSEQELSNLGIESEESAATETAERPTAAEAEAIAAQASD
jgi:hypothetical protein